MVLGRFLRSLIGDPRPGERDDGARRALALLEAGDLDAAESAALDALRADPGAALAHLALGRIALDRGAPERARESLERALAAAPDLDAARAQLAAIAVRAGRHGEAIGHYRAALGRNERSPELAHALGAALIENGDFDEAASVLARALALAPGLAAARESLSRALFNARRFADAAAVERELLRGDPDAIRLHLRLAHALLIQGRLDEGWAEYEWRLKQPGFGWGVQGLQRWDGSDPAGRTLLVVSEQGLGDAILFARFVSELARRGARVRLLCRPPLERLFRSSFEGDGVNVTADPAADASGVDAFIHLLSLPAALRLGAAAVERRTRYLRVEPRLGASWRQRVAAQPGLKVGLVWAGNAARSGDEARSLAAEAVAPLGRVPGGVSWFSLQAGLDRSAPRPFAMTDWMDSAADFADTAALIGALDLVVSVDTSVAHAAAAVGTPLWLLAPHNVCWRWEMGGADSPWYPDVRLFRASRPGAWAPVLDAVGAALQRTVSGQSAR
jgi:thioredoxin-like negative regulator of GroEL